MRLKKLVLLYALTILFTEKSFSFEEGGFSLVVPCCSYHEDEKTRQKANQTNLGLGLRYNFTDNWFHVVGRRFIIFKV